VKDFLGTEVRVEFSLRLLEREWFGEVKGEKGLAMEGARNDVALALAGVRKEEEGMVFTAEKAAIVKRWRKEEKVMECVM